MHVMAHNSDARSGDICPVQQMYPLYHLSACLREQMTTHRVNEAHLNETHSLTERYMHGIFLKHTKRENYIHHVLIDISFRDIRQLHEV